jgi:hypothetical protein
MNETPEVMTLIKKVEPTQPNLGLSTRGTFTAITLGASNARPHRAQTNEAIAILLTLTHMLWFVASAFVKAHPQELQN